MIVSNPCGRCFGRQPAIANVTSAPSASAASVGAARSCWDDSAVLIEDETVCPTPSARRWWRL